MIILDIFFKYMFFYQFKFEEFIVVLFNGCDFDDLFRILGCLDICFNILDVFEMFVFKVFIDLCKINFICERNIFVFMYKVLKKNCFYLIYMIKVIFLKFY